MISKTRIFEIVVILILLYIIFFLPNTIQDTHNCNGLCVM